MKKTEPHFEEGHLNTHVRDHDSVVTAMGEHARVVAFDPEGCAAYCRVDYRHRGLRRPTDTEIVAVFKSISSGSHGKWKVTLRRSYYYTSNRWHCEDVYLRKEST
ncbi:MAG: hypothetical protein GY826_12615 [Fuerstiella sp.]|jgi:hypothetical protein|nr:hypothetical protein [Fuerstiella sp.]